MFASPQKKRSVEGFKDGLAQRWFQPLIGFDGV